MNLRELGLDPDQLADLQSLIEKTPELRALRSMAGDTPMDRALRYMALVRLFDDGLYRHVFKAHDPDLPEFDKIIEHPEVEAVPRSAQKYWLRNSALVRRSAEWRERGEEERIWSERLHQWLVETNAAALDRLDQLLRFDTQGALSLLETEYNRADQSNNLAECHSYAERIEAEMNRIPETERSAFLQFVTRYRARALFLTELQVTTNYFPRPAIEVAFDELIRGNGKQWIMFLDAPGGLGKTTFIQRMIAHKLLNNPPFPLVVRTDLDRLDVASLTYAPWLIALEIATDLEVQLPQKLFSAGNPSFIKVAETFRPLLYQRASSRAPEVSDDHRRDLARQARDEFSQWSKFISLCTELPLGRPLMLFIDTVEEASLHLPDEFRKVLERLEILHQSLPQLRLVLSGRYRPDMKHFTSYDAKLREQTIFVSLEPLKPAESRAFIRQLIKQPPASDLVELMVESSGGNPFKLSLLCEYVTDQPSISYKDLQDFGKDADVAYLLKRVIDRIPVDKELGLRWLLRYGSIPRRLTYAFVEENLQPLLIRALKGELENLKEDIPSEREKKSWLQRAEVDLAPRFLWERLIKYSSEHGWISADRSDPDTVTVHPEVSKPMRRLLKKQISTGGTIYTTLNAEAAAHFKQLKGKFPERWLDYTLGELFHSLEAGNSDPVQLVKNAFNEKAAHGDASLRLELAREIVKADGDFAGTPAAVRSWACYEAADALAISSNFRYLPVDARRPDLSRLLAQASELAKDEQLVLPAIVWRWREFLDSNYPELRGAIFALLGLKAEDRSRYWLLLIDLVGQEKLQRRPFFILRILISILPGWVKSVRIPGWVWKERYAASLIELGGYDEAVTSLTSLLATNFDSLTTADKSRIRARMIKALMLSLRLDEAEKELEDFGVDEARADDKQMMMAEIHLLRRNSWAALECTQNLRNPKDYRANRIRGMADGQLLRVAEAGSAFKDALEAAAATGEQSRAERVLLEQLRFRLFEANLPTEILDVRSVEKVGSAALVQAELELCRAWQHRAQNPTAAQAIVQALFAKNYCTLIRTRAMLAAFSWGMLPAPAVGEMMSLLKVVDDYGARILLTAPPVEFSGKLNLDSSLATDLALLLTPINDSSSKLSWLYGAKFLSAIGKERKAEFLFRKGKISAVASPAELSMLRQFRSADRHPEPPHTWDLLRNEPGLYMAVTIECAERAWRADDHQKAREALGLSPRSPELDLRLPAFGRRRTNLEKSIGIVPDAPVEAPPSTGAQEQSQLLVLGTEGDRLVAYRSGQPSPWLISTVENDALAILAGYSKERIPRRLVELLMKEWDQTLMELCAPFEEIGLVRPSPDVEVPSNDGEVIVLSLMTPQLVAAPWELAMGDRLFDIIRLSLGVEESLPLAVTDKRANVIKRFGDSPSVSFFSPAVSISPREAEIPSMFHSELLPTIVKADILYIVSSIYSDGRGEPSLGSERLSVEALCYQIAAAYGSGTPFAVLHVPAEGSLSNILEELLVRNQFAHALVSSGVVSGVLATSAYDPNRVIEALTKARTLLEIPRLMRDERRYPRTPMEALVSFGSATFLAAQ